MSENNDDLRDKPYLWIVYSLATMPVTIVVTAMIMSVVYGGAVVDVSLPLGVSILFSPLLVVAELCVLVLAVWYSNAPHWGRQIAILSGIVHVVAMVLAWNGIGAIPIIT